VFDVDAFVVDVKTFLRYPGTSTLASPFFVDRGVDGFPVDFDWSGKVANVNCDEIRKETGCALAAGCICSFYIIKNYMKPIYIYPYVSSRKRPRVRVRQSCYEIKITSVDGTELKTSIDTNVSATFVLEHVYETYSDIPMPLREQYRVRGGKYAYDQGTYADFERLSTLILYREGLLRDGRVCMCKRCNKSLRRSKLPQFAAANGFCIGVSTVVADPPISHVERKLTSPYFCVRHLYQFSSRSRKCFPFSTNMPHEDANGVDPQSSLPNPCLDRSRPMQLVGHAHFVYLDVAEVHTSLPLRVEDVPLRVLVDGRALSSHHNQVAKFSTIRRSVVKDLLSFFVTNNKLVYGDVKIDDDQYAHLPSNEECNRTLVQECEAVDDEVRPMEVGGPLSDATSSGGLTATIGVGDDVQSNTLEVAASVLEREAGGNDSERRRTRYFGIQPSTSYMNTKNVRNSRFFAFAFPHLFPFGRGDPGDSRKMRVSLDSCIQHYLNLRRYSQFRKNEFVLVSYNRAAKESARKRTFITGLLKSNNRLYHRLTKKNMTDLAAYLRRVDEARKLHRSIPQAPADLRLAQDFMRDVKISCAEMPHSDDRMSKARLEVYAMNYAFGKPAFMLTINPTMAQSKTVFSMLGLSSDMPHIQVRSTFVNNNPGTTSIYFDRMVKLLKKHIFMWDDATGRATQVSRYGTIKAFFGVVEEQCRLALHLHILVWCENDGVDDSTESLRTKTGRTNFVNYVKNLLTTSCSMPQRAEERVATCPNCKTKDAWETGDDFYKFRLVNHSRENGAYCLTCKRCGNEANPKKLIFGALNWLWRRLLSEAEAAKNAIRSKKILEYHSYFSNACSKTRYHVSNKNVLQTIMFRQLGSHDPKYADEINQLMFAIAIAGAQLHDDRHTKSCAKSAYAKKTGMCRFRKPEKDNARTEIEEHCDEDGEKRFMLKYKRKPVDVYTTEYDPFIAAAVGCCNTHIRYAYDMNFARYISCYSAKKRRDTQKCVLDTLTNVSRKLEHIKTSDKSNFSKGLSLLSAGWWGKSRGDPVSANLAAYFLLGNASHVASHKFCNVGVSNALDILCDNDTVSYAMSSSGAAVIPNILDYIHRPNHLESVCQLDFMRDYERVRYKGRRGKRTLAAVGSRKGRDSKRQRISSPESRELDVGSFCLVRDDDVTNVLYVAKVFAITKKSVSVHIFLRRSKKLETAVFKPAYVDTDNKIVLGKHDSKKYRGAKKYTSIIDTENVDDLVVVKKILLEKLTLRIRRSELRYLRAHAARYEIHREVSSLEKKIYNIDEASIDELRHLCVSLNIRVRSDTGNYNADALREYLDQHFQYTSSTSLGNEKARPDIYIRDFCYTQEHQSTSVDEYAPMAFIGVNGKTYPSTTTRIKRRRHLAVPVLRHTRLPCISDVNVDEETESEMDASDRDHLASQREEYAKCALLMTVPFRLLEDVKCESTWWDSWLSLRSSIDSRAHAWLTNHDKFNHHHRYSPVVTDATTTENFRCIDGDGPRDTCDDTVDDFRKQLIHSQYERFCDEKEAVTVVADLVPETCTEVNLDEDSVASLKDSVWSIQDVVVQTQRNVSGSMSVNVLPTRVDEVDPNELDVEADVVDTTKTFEEIRKDVQNDFGLEERQITMFEIMAASMLRRQLETLDMSSADYRQSEMFISKFTFDEQVLMFASGEGGTGKSRVIKAFCEFTQRIGRAKALCVSATMGTSASLIDGVTWHRAVGWGQRKIKPSLQSQWQTITTMIIDEVSMLAPTQLQEIDNRLRVLTGRDKKFGDIDMFFFGDFEQLPPVMSKMLFSKNIGTHSSTYRGLHIWKNSLTHSLTLTKNFRALHDPTFQSALRSFRGTIDNTNARNTVTLLNRRCSTKPQDMYTVDTTVIVPETNTVFEKNCARARLRAFSTPKRGTWKEMGCITINGTLFYKNTQRKLDVDVADELCAIMTNRHIGTKGGNPPCTAKLNVFIKTERYILTTNGNFQRGIVNGTCCTIVDVELEDNANVRWNENDHTYCVNADQVSHLVIKYIGSQLAEKKFDNNLPAGHFVYSKQSTRGLPKTERFKISLGHDEVFTGRIWQYLIRHAATITAYKAQGATLQKVVASSLWRYKRTGERVPKKRLQKGTLYVVLSRATGFGSLRIEEGLSHQHIPKTRKEVVEETKRLGEIEERMLRKISAHRA